MNTGDEVQVTFNIRGNEYNGRYFNNLQAWKLQKIDSIMSTTSDDTIMDNDILAILADDLDNIEHNVYNESF